MFENTENQEKNPQADEEGKWLAFHQAFDSAIRAYRRGDDVSRAVNWLYVVSRKEAAPEEREMERLNREFGLGVGKSVASEIEIAPKLWKAVQAGELVSSPGETALPARAMRRDVKPGDPPLMVDGTPIPLWDGYPGDEEKKPGEGEKREEIPETKPPSPPEDNLLPGPPPNPENDSDFLI